MSYRFRMGTVFPAGAGFLFLILAAACSLNTMPTKDVWFTQHYPIMQDFERTAYRSLTEKGKMDFQELFWSSRSAESKEAFDTRMAYVKKTLWKENSQQPWNTDRGRVYLLSGSPASIDYDQNTDFNLTRLPGETAQSADRTREDVGANRAEIWTYPFNRYRIVYTFVFVKPSQWKQVLSSDRYIQEFEDFCKTETFAIQDEAKYKEALAGLAMKK